MVERAFADPVASIDKIEPRTEPRELLERERPRDGAADDDGRYWARTSDLRLVEAKQGGHGRVSKGTKRQETPAKPYLSATQAYPRVTPDTHRGVRQTCAKKRCHAPRCAGMALAPWHRGLVRAPYQTKVVAPMGR